jgi:hypothetical protein
MQARIRFDKVTVFMGGGLLLLAVGLVIEIGFARPLLREIGSMNEERSRMRTEIIRQGELDKDGSALAEVFGLADLAELGRAPVVDPLAWLGTTISDAKLVRLDLTNTGAADFGKVRRSDFTVRTRGSFAQMQQFVRSLEAGPRLVAIDAFTISTQFDKQSLEGRFMLSIYDPTGGR